MKQSVNEAENDKTKKLNCQTFEEEMEKKNKKNRDALRRYI